ncbi:MAG: methylase [Paenibacillus sp.]|jgi:type I restriction enzyme M protein|nr:methylase [Paenibacillus sp.]
MNGTNATAFSRYMQDAMFLVPTPQVLQKIITGLNELYEHDIKDLDMLAKAPFDKPQSIFKLFDGSKQKRLIETVTQIKDNAVKIL